MECYLALGEDTHTLRLTSELVDLRSGYANPAPREMLGAGVQTRYSAVKGKKSTPSDDGRKDSQVCLRRVCRSGYTLCIAPLLFWL